MRALISTLELDETYSDDDALYNDLGILSIEELRSAAGVTGEAEDEALALLGNVIAETFAQETNMRVAEGSVATLRSQALKQTFYIESDTPHPVLLLARFPIQEVVSVVQDDVEVETTDYHVDKATGRIRMDDYNTFQGTVIVKFVGGHATVPNPLKYAAQQMVAWARANEVATDREAAVRRVQVDGVGSVDYMVENASNVASKPLIPGHIRVMLGPYRDARV